MKARWDWLQTGRGAAACIGAVVIGTVLAGSAVAQPPGGGRGFGGGFGGGLGGGRGGPGGVLALLTQEAVQKELGLTPETVEKGRKLVDEVRAAGQAEMASLFGEGGFQNMTEEQRRELPAKMAAMTAALQEKFAPKAKELLTAEQYTRLQQIAWQAAGAAEPPPFNAQVGARACLGALGWGRRAEACVQGRGTEERLAGLLG